MRDKLPNTREELLSSDVEKNIILFYMCGVKKFPHMCGLLYLRALHWRLLLPHARLAGYLGQVLHELS